MRTPFSFIYGNIKLKFWKETRAENFNHSLRKKVEADAETLCMCVGRSEGVGENVRGNGSVIEMVPHLKSIFSLFPDHGIILLCLFKLVSKTTMAEQHQLPVILHKL